MIKSKKIAIFILPMFLLLQGCAHKKVDNYPIENTVPKYEEADKVSPIVDEHDMDYDKYESFNRFSFEINNQLDRFILRPLAVGYRTITTQYIRDRVRSALTNIKEPIYSVNNMLQGEFIAGLKNIGRFAINSTLGLAGMYDVAGGGFGLEPSPSSFDKTLANWGVKDGPYLVLPILGSTTPRALVGDTFDGLGNPVYLATYNDANIRDKIIYPYIALSAVSAREASLEFIDDFRKNSVDFYSTVRSAYIQNRKKIIKSNEGSPVLDYDFDMDDED